MKASLIALTAAAALSAAAENFADFALPVVGTDNTKELSNGNLYPCIARPWGAHGWSPQTGDNDTGWFYAYGDRKICGIRQTHQPSPWIGDYGQFSLMPAKELDRFDAASRASWFSHKTCGPRRDGRGRAIVPRRRDARDVSEDGPSAVRR